MDAPARAKSLPNQMVINTYGQKNNFLANSIKRLQSLRPAFDLVPNLMRTLLHFLSLLIITSVTQSAQKPNLVLIFIDDMGYGDIGPFGSKLNRTPHLDRMAKEGMKLTSFYAAPVCSASRAQLMTGCYAPRVSVPGVFFPASSAGLNPDEHTVADYLRELGYATSCIGKWHLGDQRAFLPVNNGFDHYFGVPYSNDMPRTSAETGKAVHPLVRDDQVAELLEYEDQRRLTREYTEEAVKFIKTNHKAKKKFFLYLPHTAMHVPLYPHPDFAGKSKNGTYGDWVEELDWSVGQVLQTLRSLGIEKETLVIFTSDNGPWASKGKNGGVSGPLRGSKGCTLEGGVREPTIAWWPGNIEAGTESSGIAGTTDILPTFVSLAGGKTRKKVAIDGIDISPMLLKSGHASPRDTWYYYRGNRLQAVRHGPWKLALTAQSLGMGINQKDADLAKGGRLYNLEEEIGEKTDLADKHPEIVEKLEQLAEKMRADIGDGGRGPGVRPAGRVNNPVTLYPTTGKRRKSPKPSGKPLDWSKIKLGGVYSTSTAPAIAGKPFTVECQVDGPLTDGVLLAHGGSSVGYALYVKANEITFAVRTGNADVKRVSTKISEGPNKIQAKLDTKGSLSLSINGGKPAITKGKGLIRNHPQEDLSIGHDDKVPVDDQAPRNHFKGRLSAVKVTISK